MRSGRARTQLRRMLVLLSAALSATTLVACAAAGGGASPTPGPTPSPTPTPSCAARLVDEMSPDELAGQLIVVGLNVKQPVTAVDTIVQQYHLGGVVLLGGWHAGLAAAQAATSHLQGLAGASTAGLGLLIAVDQEGGEVQQLQGQGFTAMPTALAQGQLDPQALTTDAQGWAGEIKAAGVNLNLAPVADTVPASLGTGNAPIGGYQREYGNDPSVVAPHVVAVVDGMTAGGMATTLKHFPGLGRVTGDTDVTDQGITDTETTTTDPYLDPFRDGIRAGAPVVMVSSAFYSQIDPQNQAAFSSTIITGLLRGSIGFDGVVMSDDLGAAKAVAAIAPAQRATSFITAGGDIMISAGSDTVGPFHDAIVAGMSDAGFSAKVAAAATRVLELKVTLGLASCG